ncbi:MAG TPA: universal stress protein [Stellaceae bacterium]|nr:universal stress protein [Stellaceae bacterium]
MSGPLERIVVALDATSENRAAISTAARLAARWKAHLHGVFFEDDDLIRLASLPFARQVSIGFGAERFDVKAAERQLRVYAERARQELAASARRHGVEWSFEIARGAVATGHSGDADDFLVACTATRPVGGHFRVECRWWSAEGGGPAARLLATQEAEPNGAVAALLQGQSASSGRLLAAALRLAEANDARLVVICPAALAADAGFKPWLDQQLAGHKVEVDLELLPEGAAAQHRITELRCHYVAVEADSDEASPDRLRAMMATLACDVLVVR